MDQSKKLGWKNWLSIIMIGLAGQIAWAIENQYINLWVYSQAPDYRYITWMTIASAVVATITTFFMGALSDRIGKRKIFIAGGYVVWGVTVFLFGIMSKGNMSAMAGAARAAFMVGVMNCVVDCLMTFFGSTSNDACFNAHVTDITNETNRPKVESVLSVMPLIAMIAMIGVAALLGLPGSGLTAEEAAPKWLIFFLIFGSLTTLIGIASFFLLPKDQIAPNRSEPYMKNLVYGFRPKVVKANPLFYIALLSFLFFNIAVDSFMPYYLVYFTNSTAYGGLGLGDSYVWAMAIIIVVASLTVLVFGFFMDKIGKMKLLIPAIGVMALGALLFFFANGIAMAIIAGTLLMIGYLVGTTVLGAELRDQTPKNEVGLFQGVRMIGAVMLPMIIGSKASDLVFSFANTKYIDDYGQEVNAPSKWMFIVTLCAAVLAVVPAVWLIIKSKKMPKKPEIQMPVEGK